MRLLFAIPHFVDGAQGPAVHGSLAGNSAARVRVLTDALAAIRQNFGRPQCQIDIAKRTTFPANQLTAETADVLVCTTGTKHALGELPIGNGYYTHIPTAAEPRLLGFECHRVLRDKLADGYDYYCYLEDDLILRDSLFFTKLRWFTQRFGEEALLAPNRYEVARNRIVHKAYVDGPIREEAAAAYQNVKDRSILDAEALGLRVRFQRVTNPHSGAFFLTATQMATWAARSYFLDRDTGFIGPLESAATLGVMRTFRIYKPVVENAAFLEVEHAGTGFLSRIVPPPPTA